jgi:hypothetical protein
MNESESNMEEYGLTPKSYKDALPASAPSQEIGLDEIIAASLPQIKVAALAVGNRDLSVYHGFLRTLEAMKSSEEQCVEKMASEIRRDTTVMVSNNESIGDISKLACRYVKSKGLGIDKVASLYQETYAELVASGFKVNDEFTKISSAPLDMSSPVFRPSFEYALGLEKIAALNEMIDRVKATIDSYKVVAESMVAKLA